MAILFFASGVWKDITHVQIRWFPRCRSIRKTGRREMLLLLMKSWCPSLRRGQLAMYSLDCEEISTGRRPLTVLSGNGSIQVHATQYDDPG
jgi:hypothetical protein